MLKDSDNNGINDGEELYNTTVTINEMERDEKVEPSVVMNIEGEYIGEVAISNLGDSDPYLNQNIPGYIGSAFNFITEASFESAEMKFKFNKALLEEPNFEPAIYYFNEETSLLELLPNQIIDYEECVVRTNVEHFSSYILLNKREFDEVWEKEMKPPHEGEIENIELVIGFAIDSSGSMQWNDRYDIRKQTAKDFVDKLDENDKAAVIDFDHWASVNCELTDDKKVIKNAIDRIDSDGGTDIGEGIRLALEQLQKSTSEIKYVILLTDGVGDYDSSLTRKAKEQNIVVYTIGLGYDIDEELLRTIAEETGGKYYHASSSEDLYDVFNQTSEDTVDLTKDTDGDGLSDYHEKKGIRTNTGKWIFTYYNDPDSDNDGLLDGEELVYKGNLTTMSHYFMKSNPEKADSDEDGINDKNDPEPMIYSITDRTLALAAGLSYTNLKSRIGEKVGFKGEPELSEFKIVGANDSGMLTFNDFFDGGLGSVAIKLSIRGKNDALIFALRGTEPTKNLIDDGNTDLFLGIGIDTQQSKKAFKEYKKLANKFPNSDIYLSGHSLGGRLVQDTLYNIYDDNNGYFGLFKKNIKEPIRSATFNALGYNKVQYFDNWLFNDSLVEDIKDVLYNYYYKNDFVGEGLGHSWVYKRLGTDIGPWIAKDENGDIIVEEDKWGYAIAKLHSIELFYEGTNFNVK